MTTTESPAPASDELATPRQAALLYDDGCRFCRAMTRAIAAWDRPRRLAILPWSHPLAAEWLAPLPEARLHRSMHLRLPSRRLVSGGDSFVLLLRYLPGTGWLSHLALRLPPLRWLIGGAYMLVARARGPLSRIAPNTGPVLREPRQP